ncbi:MAG: 3-methyl-2-oxobutanoate hydroxymethyltransferase, partial [Verrucomicrobiia bacterium]
LYTDAISLEEAGCFAVIAEMMDERIAAQLSTQILPPLIGIGSGDKCDGQILVTHDLLGLTPSPLPSFVKPCATLGLDGLNALTNYVQKTRSNPIAKK